MGSDVSRERFDALRDHSGVRLQQGRLLLDADWNELVAIIDRRLRANAADLGTTGVVPGVAGAAVVPRTTPDGFRIDATGGALTIGVGRMYVDGLLAENHGLPDLAFDPLLAEQVGTGPLPYDQQPYWPTPDALPPDGTHLAYLDVWDREVTPLEAPDLVESAVGVDTTTRTQTVWQVRVLPEDAGTAGCDTPEGDLPGWLDVTTPSAGRMTTGTVPVDDVDDPCELPPSGGYRGPENQTYRVEIHDGGPAGTATFTWSRDNGSVASPVVEVVSSTRVRPATLGRDGVLRFRTGDWVEILDDHRELDQRAGEMRRVVAHDEDGTVSWTDPLPADLQMTTAQAAERHLRVRRWDQSGTVRTTGGTTVVDLDLPAATGVIPVPAGSPAIVLEHGVTVQLRAPGGRFRPGDHWVFAARTADTSVEELIDAPPRGIHHHYARLALVTFPGSETDCRTLWPPLSTGGDTCGDCTVCVTPESHASGALTIQAAIDHVTPTGGTVCLATGIYALPENGVRIVGASSITLRGQGPRTLLLARADAVAVERSAFVRLEDFAVISASGAAGVRLQTTAAVTAQRLTVLVLSREGTTAAGFDLAGVSLLTRLRDNLVLAPVGIAGGDGEKAPLLTAALDVAGNVLVSPTAGVALSGQVAHLLANVVCDNTVMRADAAGIRTLGLVGPGGSFTVAGNSAVVGGAGVEVGTSGFEVRDNDITGTPQSLEIRGDGIAVQPGTFGRVRGLTRIWRNHVRDVGGTGIAVRAPVGDLDVSRNMVERARQGIVVEDRGRATSATVAGNVVRDIAARQSDAGVGLVGIQVVGADRATIDGNTVVGVATAREARDGPAGVRVLASLESRVAGNSVDHVGFEESPGQSVGILVAGFFRRTLADGNASRRLPDDVDAAPLAPWVGLQIGARPDPESGVASHHGDYIAVPGQVSYLVGSKAAFAFAGSGDVSAVVDANTVTGGGRAPAALLVVPGDAVVSSNQCRMALESETPAVLLVASAATVTANRARGGKPSMRLEVPEGRLAVIGNLTSTGIDAPNGFDPAMAPLNPDGIF